MAHARAGRQYTLRSVPLAVRYSYTLVPLGFGMWLAHYGFHFFTGILTIVPVTQTALANLGCALVRDASLDVDWFANTICSAAGIGIPPAGIRRFAPGGAYLGGGRLRPSADARVYPVGGRLCFGGVGVGVADVSADGNARDDDGWMMARMRAMMKSRGNRRVLPTVLACFWTSLLAMLCAPSAEAHNGPPFPIITDQRVGPYIISLWTHPDLGIGTFFVMVDLVPGGTVPKDLKIQIGDATGEWQAG